jgi:anthranilate synthase component 2
MPPPPPPPPAGDVVRAPSGVMHGKTSPVFHINEGLMEGLDK